MNDALVAFDDGSARAVIDLLVYRLAAVKKAAYRVADRCTVALGTPADEALPVEFLFAPGTSDSAARSAVRAFYQELLDQELREHIAEETGPLRALILAHAFSKTDLIRRR
ncbi:MAG TPA: His-Xaa-Ser system protein HxsD [Polyangiaceae bacterium]